MATPVEDKIVKGDSIPTIREWVRTLLQGKAGKTQVHSSAEWQGVYSTVILETGVLGIESDTNKIKLGDGTTAWSSLNYLVDIGNATVAIKKDGILISSFTLNQSANVEINIPEKITDVRRNNVSVVTDGVANISVPTTPADIGAYAKPENGIPETDLKLSVQTSLGKADTALQPRNIKDALDSTSTTDALSANMGKELNERIDNLSGRGRFLSSWDCTIGKAQTTPTSNPYTYHSGDYFIVGVVQTNPALNNYKPYGQQYDHDVQSTVVETDPVAVNDTYYFDGTTWHLQHGTEKEVTFNSIQGNATDNSSLAGELNRCAIGVEQESGTSGNVVTGITYDSANRKVKFTKGNISLYPTVQTTEDIYMGGYSTNTASGEMRVVK